MLRIIPDTFPHFVIQALSVSGAVESTTLGYEPAQDNTCCLRGFLGSLRSLGMTGRYVVPFNHTGCICNVDGGKIAAATCTLTGGSIYPLRLYSGGYMAMDHRRYIGGTVYDERQRIECRLDW